MVGVVAILYGDPGMSGIAGFVPVVNYVTMSEIMSKRVEKEGMMEIG